MLTELLEQKPRFINEMIEEGDCLMRAIHYPANPPEDAVWAGAHTGIDFFHNPPAISCLSLSSRAQSNDYEK